MYDEEPSQYCHDWLQAQLDCTGDPDELEREEDDIDKKDHEALYCEELDDYPDEMPDLEESKSVNTLMCDWLGATPASTVISTDTEAAGELFNLSMGPPELLATQETSDSVGLTDEGLSDDDQFSNMFKVPPKVPAPRDLPLPRLLLDPRTLMAEAKFKSGCRTLPPPPGLKRQDVSDGWNVVLCSNQKWKTLRSRLLIPRTRTRCTWTGMLIEIRLCRLCKKGVEENPAPAVWGPGKAAVNAMSGSQSRDEIGPKRG